MDNQFSPHDLVCFIIVWSTHFCTNISIWSVKILSKNSEVQSFIGLFTIFR